MAFGRRTGVRSAFIRGTPSRATTGHGVVARRSWEGGPRVDGLALGTAAGALALFGALAFYVLAVGHPHEDAYILFTYVENLVGGHGIAYYPGGPPAEGATDFLWLLLLAMLRGLGLDTALAAGAVNAVSIAGLAYLLARASGGLVDLVTRALLSTAGLAVLLTSGLVEASVSGFGTAFYALATAILFCLVREARPEILRWTPYLGLVLGLIRPDGVILGVGYVAVVAYQLWGTASWRPFLRHAALTALLGGVYFVGRWTYFGLPLPLPLYVKSAHEAIAPGVYDNLKWLIENAVLVVLAGLFIAVAEARGRTVAAWLPLLVFLGVFSFAVQSQNVGMRFQAPLFVPLLICALLALTTAIRKLSRLKGRLLATILLVPVAVFQAPNLKEQVDYLTNDDYINFFPAYASKILKPDMRLALTEAGRLAFWTQAKTYDLVGLNTKETARKPVDMRYLARIAPEAILIHTAGTLGGLRCQDGPVCIVSSERIWERAGSRNWRAVQERVKRAPLVVYDYLRAEGARYTIFLVRYGDAFDHLYAVRNDVPPLADQWRDALRQSFSEQAHRSYWSMRRMLE